MTPPRGELPARARSTTCGDGCAECARSVATAVERLPGVAAATVNFGAGTLTVETDSRSQVDVTPRVLHAVEVAGYRAVSQGAARASGLLRAADRRSQLAIAAVVAGSWGVRSS
ncbi:MAG: heavy metal-associated domain-containing protein [Thermomicrobiales bacterium]